MQSLQLLNTRIKKHPSELDAVDKSYSRVPRLVPAVFRKRLGRGDYPRYPGESVIGCTAALAVLVTLDLLHSPGIGFAVVTLGLDIYN